MTDAMNLVSGLGFGALALGSATNVSLNGSGIGVAWVQQVQTTSPITRVRFLYGSRTGTPPTYVLTLETLDTSGNPSGTDIGGGSPTATTFTPPANGTWDNTVREITLTNAWTPSSPSTSFAITIRHSSGTVDGSNFSSVVRVVANASASATHIPSTRTLSGGSWTAQAVRGNISWGTASRLYNKIVTGGYTTATANTAGHRQAMFFTLPSGLGTTFTVNRIYAICKFAAAAGSLKFAIWSTGGSVLAEHTIDADISTNQNTNRLSLIYFDAAATLDFGTKYYVGIEVVSGTINVTGAQLADATEKVVWPLGANIGFASFDGSSWTESAAIVPFIELGFSDITVPSGSGGGAIVIGG